MEITGRITGDAQVKKIKGGKEVTAFTIVLNERYKAKGGEAKKVSTFINCSYWLSMKLAPHLKKGSIVTVSGSIGLNAYKTNDGEYHAHLTFHCNHIQMVTGAGKNIQQAAGTAAAEPVDDLPF